MPDTTAVRRALLFLALGSVRATLPAAACTDDDDDDDDGRRRGDGDDDD
jgi:hypothetical protein